MEKTISIERLKKLALALKFDMDEDHYVQLQKDFETLLQQMDFINQNINTDGVENYVFLVRKEQLCGMDYLLKSVIIPELNCRDKKAGVE